MERNNSLTKDAETALEGIEEIISNISFIRDKLRQAFDEYRYQGSYHNRLELESALLLYKKYLVDGRIELLNLDDIGELAILEGNSKFNVLIAKDWNAYEFTEIFKSVNQLYELAFVDGNIRIISDRKRQSRYRMKGRKDRNYNEGNLDQYFEYEERLMVNKVLYSSPGEIEFISLVIEHSPSIIKSVLLMFGVIKFVPDFLERLPGVYQKWVKSIVAIHEMRRVNARQEIIHQILQGKLKDLTDDQDLHIDDLEKVQLLLEEITDKITPIAEAEITDAGELTDKTFKAIAILAKLYKQGKLNLPG